ncbi:DoxX family protein [Hymenobacter chitinivorans]|uniref:DoxX-like protein n=1 Tax=Hymenobacter chitinivorans DSM 11115 TaxID=1121954 RepID=A0A2M9BRB0_9BACT|nr:DoxX family protein [Hymenobacter chitinivorans]PJJ60480.1 DoxX-like protein [Hymenobacter chitinivorans DSM 11115]
MKPRTLTRLYWALTGLFTMLMLMDGVAGILQVADGQAAMHQLGYPVYLMTILGTAKILGSVALLQPFFRTVKEWAYAGFAISFIGAALSWALSGGGVGMVLPPVVMLVALLGLHALWRQYERRDKSTTTLPEYTSAEAVSVS